MKWFKHFSDAYTNLKLQPVLVRYGVEGYGLYWMCLELIAQQGKNYKITSDKDWKGTLTYITKFKEDKIVEIINFYAEKDLINKSALDKGDLYIPKMKEYADEYTKKLRIKSRHTPDNVRLEQNRTDKNIIRQNYFKKGTGTPKTSAEETKQMLKRLEQ